MLNQIVLVGRIAKGPEIRETDNGKKVASILLAVPRSFKNQDGEYDTDFLPCTLWDGVATNVSEYCKTGDLVGIKGRVQSDIYETNEKKHYEVEVIDEKVTFLSSKPKEENPNTEENPKKNKKAD